MSADDHVQTEDNHSPKIITDEVGSSEDEEQKQKRKFSKWKELVMKKKASFLRVLKTAAQILLLIYLFMCGIDLLTSSFKLIGGKNINGLTERGTLHNPLVGLIVGILVTVMVQSSSTATAIIVSLVGSGVIGIREAIPVVMGSNIGTSVTNTFVAFSQAGDRATFRRAFAGATVHDMFNWLSVISLLSVEVITRSIPKSKGFLEIITELAVNATYTESVSQSEASSGLKELVTPLTTRIIRINNRIIECWARNESKSVTTLVERYCDPPNYLLPAHIEDCPADNPKGLVRCCFLFANSPLSDLEIGIILLISSLSLLIICLVVLVRVLNAVLQGTVQEVVKKYINADIPRAPYLTGYCALVVGAVMTVIMQSSSIFTSLLTPLIGMDIVSIERCYPLTLGSNIGTTATAILAAFTENTKSAVQIALVHLFFNLFGILLFYPIPFMRFPIPMSKILGEITSRYRWFAVLYILAMFAFIPGFLLLLSEAGAVAFWSVLGLLFLFASAIFVVNVLQRRKPNILPAILRNWDFLPLYLRSLEPYDRLITSACRCGKGIEEASPSTSELTRVVTDATVSKATGSQDSGIDNIKENTDLR